MFGTVAVCASLLSALVAQSGRPAQAPPVVTVNVFFSAQAALENLQTVPTRDQVTVKIHEKCTYKVAEWKDVVIYLDPPECQTSVTVDGRGVQQATEYSPRKEWVYSWVKPQSPVSTLTLDPETGVGEVTVSPVSLTMKMAGLGKEAKGGKEQAGAGPAALAIDMLRVAIGGIVPPGAVYAGGPPLGELERFKFPAKADRFSGGNNGHYSLKQADLDGSAASATMTVDYTVEWGPPQK